MSSRMNNRRRIDAGLVSLAFAAFTVWYAHGQLLYTLYFGYQLARYLFPHWLPSLSG
jgi:hypothetical protein